MNRFDVVDAIQWTLAFQSNLAPPNMELTQRELTKAAADFLRGYDPLESAHEINAERGIA